MNTNKPLYCRECGGYIGTAGEDVLHVCQPTSIDYKTAMTVQSACNLGAVVHSFSKVMKKIQVAGRKKGTDWVNNHAIARMYAEQIMHLTRNKTYNEAYDECETLGELEVSHIVAGKEVINIEGDENYENVKLNGEILDPARSLKVRNHSPDGFSWGYTGSGPAQFALAILLECLPKKMAEKYYHPFMQQYIAALPQCQSFSVNIDIKAFVDKMQGVPV